jgi:hypothetical protein
MSERDGMSARGGGVRETGTLPRALVGAALLGIGLLLAAFDATIGAPDLVSAALVAIGGLCVTTALVLGVVGLLSRPDPS